MGALEDLMTLKREGGVEIYDSTGFSVNEANKQINEGKIRNIEEIKRILKPNQREIGFSYLAGLFVPVFPPNEIFKGLVVLEKPDGTLTPFSDNYSTLEEALDVDSESIDKLFSSSYSFLYITSSPKTGIEYYNNHLSKQLNGLKLCDSFSNKSIKILKDDDKAKSDSITPFQYGVVKCEEQSYGLELAFETAYGDNLTTFLLEVDGINKRVTPKLTVIHYFDFLKHKDLDIPKYAKFIFSKNGNLNNDSELFIDGNTNVDNDLFLPMLLDNKDFSTYFGSGSSKKPLIDYVNVIKNIVKTAQESDEIQYIDIKHLKGGSSRGAYSINPLKVLGLEEVKK